MILKRKSHYKFIALASLLIPPLVVFGQRCLSSYLKGKKCDPMRPKEEKRFGEHKDRDLVDESGWESFPCSDPPAHAPRLD